MQPKTKRKNRTFADEDKEALISKIEATKKGDASKILQVACKKAGINKYQYTNWKMVSYVCRYDCKK